MTTPRLRAGIAGLGQVGLLFDDDAKRTGVWTHFSAYEELADRYQLIAACDPDPARRRKAADRDSCLRLHDSLDAMLAAERLDVVSLCTPPGLHLAQIDACAGRVRAVICEKPLGGGRFEAGRQTVERCVARGTLLAVNYYKRYDGCVPAASERLRSGAIGELRSATAIYAGPLEAVGSHALDLLTFLAGPLTLLSAARRAPDRLMAVLGFGASGLACLQETGPREDLVFEIDLIGSEGRLRILDNAARLEEFRFMPSARYEHYRELAPQPSSGAADGARFIPLFKEVAAALSGAVAPVTSNGTTALETERLLEAIERTSGGD
ncbi:MAG TPA: Gfo/Idh/MocA family oxidoreductase [Vicinamibacterales bacterium]|nr:Gfo/Idh/MocA family oxidoreductase [Vicinamibacterales bacterium]